ncbi:MAG: hypothetical protein ABSG74_08435 [Candidatus Bathyarchaeia archaeon]|jgi:hypothetical protein
MKRDQEKRAVYAAFLLLVSIFGLVISTALLRNHFSFGAGLGYRRTLMVLVYDLVCIAGILAVLFPIACSRLSGARFSSAESPQLFGIRATRFLGFLVVHGHHPSGSELAKHELLVRGRSYCATCYGLLTGAVVSLTIMTAFAVSGWQGWVGTYSAYLVYYVGVAAVITGLLQPLVLEVGAKARFVLAFVFVVGTSLMLLVTELLSANLMADLFVILLVIFWLLSRISLSHWS